MHNLWGRRDFDLVIRWWLVEFEKEGFGELRDVSIVCEIYEIMLVISIKLCLTFWASVLNHILVYIVEVFVKTTKYAYLCCSFLCNELQSFTTERQNGIATGVHVEIHQILHFISFMLLLKNWFVKSQFFFLSYCAEKKDFSIWYWFL